jgi:hypothetical protein
MQRQDTVSENPWKSYFQVISKYCGEIVQHLKLVSDLVQSVVRYGRYPFLVIPYCLGKIQKMMVGSLIR